MKMKISAATTQQQSAEVMSVAQKGTSCIWVIVLIIFFSTAGASVQLPLHPLEITFKYDIPLELAEIQFPPHPLSLAASKQGLLSPSPYKVNKFKR